MTIGPTLQPSRGLAVACVLALAIWSGAVLADEPSPGELARDLAAEVMRRAGGGENGLGDWSRAVVDRALERAGRATHGPAPAPLPAERHAGRLAAARPNTAEVIVFTSLSVPAASWREWAREAARTGAPLVLRGVGTDGFRATVKRIGERLGGHEAGVAVDPRLFRLFRIGRVPAVVVAPGGVPPCASRGCADYPAPPHDLVTGNIGLGSALEAVAAEGGAGRDAARTALARLRGEPQ